MIFTDATFMRMDTALLGITRVHREKIVLTCAETLALDVDMPIASIRTTIRIGEKSSSLRRSTFYLFSRSFALIKILLSLAYVYYIDSLVLFFFSSHCRRYCP